jgi:(1->4)-alpha-D-glucan 1-alpha-D-glucosylmutase
MGLILDFVPNHMGVHHADNAWWLDVLEWGPRSAYAKFFDIDWMTLPGKPGGGVLLPILGHPYAQVLEGGEIELRWDTAQGSFSAWYYDHRLPIDPVRYGEILRKVVAQTGSATQPVGAQLLAVADRYSGPRNPSPERSGTMKAELAAIAGGADLIEQGLRTYRPASGEGAALSLHHLLERQHYRVAHWRLAVTEINYRRFFDINDLAGVQVEERETFEALHRLVGRLIAEGKLQGLRIDHIDGLRDPTRYLRRLQRLIELNAHRGSAPPFLVVEKILADGERDPPFRGIAGTTGYAALNTISRVMLDDSGLQVLDRLWSGIRAERASFERVLLQAKRRVLENILASEFTVLVRLLARIAEGHYSTRDYTAHRLRTALELFVLNLPVYRTYITTAGANDADRAIIEGVVTKARAHWFGTDRDIFDFLRDVITLDLIAPGRVGHSRPRVRRFAFKLQQFTGPLMAKSLEDTAFYRFHRLLALNEVGGDPAAQPIAVEEFHRRMEARTRRLPLGLTATATHDTKRGEDARARILGLSELAEEWTEAVRDWRQSNATQVTASGPTAAHEYMLYQALLGAWPLDGLRPEFVERMQAYAIKAVREGKEQSSWLAPNETYEQAISGFVRHLLDPEKSERFIASFQAFAARATLIGALKTLAQVTLKMTIPGVPDLYQGTELWDLSLVDPDNRRPVDFASRASRLQGLGEEPDWGALAQSWQDARIKFALTRRLLRLRQKFPVVFTHGDYVPLEVTGPSRDEIIAFARVGLEQAIIVAVARTFGRASERGRCWPVGDAWDASLSAKGLSQIENELVDRPVTDQACIPIATVFRALPLAIFSGRPIKATAARRSRASGPP